MQGNNQVLEHFLASVERRAYRMACIATGNSDEALDIVQDSMYSLVQRYASKPQDTWRPLFFKILQSKIRDWYRRDKVRRRWRGWLDYLKNDDENKEDPIEATPDFAGKSPEDQTTLNKSMAALESALQTLSLRQQQVFLLRNWEGLDVADTAKAMGCSAGSVKTHYSRAIQNLRNEMSPEERKHARERFRRFRRLPPAEQKKLLNARRRFKNLPPEKKRELRKRWRELPPEKRERLRNRLKDASPEERKILREEIRERRLERLQNRRERLRRR